MNDARDKMCFLTHLEDLLVGEADTPRGVVIHHVTSCHVSRVTCPHHAAAYRELETNPHYD